MLRPLMSNKNLKTKIPKSWQIIRLDEISEKITDGTHHTPTYIDRGVPFISVKDIYNDKVHFDDCKYISKEEHEELAQRCNPEKDDILITKSGTIGRLAIAPDKSFGLFVSVALIKIQSTKNNVLPKFLYYHLKHHVQNLNIQSDIKGGVLKNYHLEDIRLIEIFLPPLNEQNRIVSKIDQLLSELEKGKEQLETANKQLGVYRQSLLKWAFEGRLTENWRENKKLKSSQEIIREIDSIQNSIKKNESSDSKDFNDKVKSLKKMNLLTKEEESNLPKLPDGWFWIRLIDISTEIKNVTAKEKKNGKRFRYLDIGGIDNKKNRIAEHKELRWDNAPSRAQKIVQTNDILFSTVRTYMRNIAMVTNKIYNNQICSSGFSVIRPLKNVINPHYIFNYVLTEKFLQPLNVLQTGSSYPAVRDKDVFNQPIPVCSIEEQNAIADELEVRFSVCSKLEETISYNIEQARLLKRSILQKAFEGKLVPQDVNDESVKELITRIKEDRELFVTQEKKRKKEIPRIIKTKTMAKELKSILELVRQSKKPISASVLWKSSEHKDNIDDFYSSLKKHINSGEIKEAPRKGKESFLTNSK